MGGWVGPRELHVWAHAVDEPGSVVGGVGVDSRLCIGIPGRLPRMHGLFVGVYFWSIDRVSPRSSPPQDLSMSSHSGTWDTRSIDAYTTALQSLSLSLSILQRKDIGWMAYLALIRIFVICTPATSKTVIDAPKMSNMFFFLSHPDKSQKRIDEGR